MDFAITLSNCHPFSMDFRNILDLGGTLGEYYPMSQKGYEEDLAALRSDWIVVGQDFRDAIAAYADSEISERLLNE